MTVNEIKTAIKNVLNSDEVQKAPNFKDGQNAIAQGLADVISSAIRDGINSAVIEYDLAMEVSPTITGTITIKASEA
ncbi:hypothetical protein AGMMS49525_02600 [Bacteroidia bacterium]|nr:hypothetical protein AGMMS49525_02600 [Bacteroidia bacterium]